MTDSFRMLAPKKLVALLDARGVDPIAAVNNPLGLDVRDAGPLRLFAVAS